MSDSNSLIEEKSTDAGKARAVGLVLLKKYRQAAAIYDELLQKEPDNEAFRINKAVCEFKASSDKTAAFDEIKQKENLSAQEYLCLADVSIKAQRMEEALDFLDKALEKENGNIEAYMLKATIFNDLNRQQELYDLIRSIYPRFKKDERVLCLTAFYSTLFQNMRQANYVLNKAFDFNRKAVIHNRFFYLALLNMDRIEEIADYAHEALSFDNRNSFIWNILTQVYQDVEDYNSADKMFEGLARLEELSKDKKLQWSAVLLKIREYDRFFDLICQISPDSEEWFLQIQEFFAQLQQENLLGKCQEKAEILEKRYGDYPEIVFICDAVWNRNRVEDKPLSLICLDSEYKAESSREFSETPMYFTPFSVKEALEECSVPTASSLDILDLGCGTGGLAYLLKEYASPSGTMIGVDVSLSVLEMAANLNKYSHLYRNDIYSFCEERKGKAQYDIIVCMDVTSGFSDLFRLFEAVSSCLKPDGVFVFSVLLPEDDERSFVFQAGLFYHSAEYVSGCLNAFGLTEEYRQKASLYQDEKTARRSMIFCVRKKA